MSERNDELLYDQADYLTKYRKENPEPTIYTCGAKPVGCACGKGCDFPCWQRVGIAGPCENCGCGK